MRKKFFFPPLILFCLFPGLVQSKPVLLSVPFTSQAPEGNWIEPWDNACEETSILMVEMYYQGNSNVNVEESKKQIQNILKKKESLYGKSKDESPEKIIQMIETLYKRKASLQKDITTEKIKNQIDLGQPVIIAFDTRLIKNPNFIAPQPTYHVAVIVGYDDETKEFLVNDPGSSDGEQFRYGYEELLAANKNYTVRDTGEVGGNEAIFTSSNFAHATKGFWAKLFEFLKKFFM